MGRHFKDRTGERFISNEGYEFIIVEYVKNSDVTVEFQDEYKARVHTAYGACKGGEVKNPYHKSVYGVGCLGIGNFVTKIDGECTREYNLWRRMLQRCYTNKDKYKTYANVTVCERWLCFANFLEDLPKIEGYQLWLNNPNQRIALDKDLKQVGVENKVYSLETCKFVTSSENSKEVRERANQKTKVICLETQQVFGSIKDAEKWCGKKGVSGCCRGINKSAGGFHWQFLDDYKRQLRLQSDIGNSQAA